MTMTDDKDREEGTRADAEFEAAAKEMASAQAEFEMHSLMNMPRDHEKRLEASAAFHKAKARMLAAQGRMSRASEAKFGPTDLTVED